MRLLKIDRCFKRLFTLLIICVVPHIVASQERDDKGYIIESKYNPSDTLFISDLYMKAIVAESIDADSSKAYSYYTKIAEIDSLHAPTLHKLALYSDTPKEGLHYINRAIAIDSTNITYCGIQLDMLRRAGDYNAAIKTCDNLIKLDSKDTYPHINKALLQVATGKPYMAISTILSAMEQFGERLELVHYLQNIYQRLRMYDKALEMGDKLLDIMPDNITFVLTQAGINTEKRDLVEAERLFDVAKQIDSTSIDYQLAINDFYKFNGTKNQFLASLVNLFANQEMTLESKIEYFNTNIRNEEYYQNHYYDVDALVRAVRVAHPLEWDAKKMYATHLVNSGRQNDALKVYEKEIEEESEHQLEAYQYLLGIESYLKIDRDSLINRAITANNLFPESRELKLQASSILAENGEVELAIKMAEWCVKRAESDSTKSEMLGYVGDLYHIADKIKKTYKYYDQALKYNPNNIVVLNNYSYFLSQEGKSLDKALAMASLVMLSEPNNATYLDTYGWILHKLERNEEAKAQILRAIALDSSNSSELLLHMGDICLALGDKISAEIYWDRALKAGADEDMVREKKMQ